MGGGIAQHLALEHGGRVATLTLISTTPAGPRRAGNLELPGMSAELTARFAAPAHEPDWSDRDAVVDYIVEGLRPVRRFVAVRRGATARLGRTRL